MLKVKRIKSFVKRQGRNAGGNLAKLSHFEKNLVDFIPGVKARLPFINEAPLALEIGFGDGKNLIHMARMLPKQNFLGVDVYLPGIAHALEQSELCELTNLKIVNADCVDLLSECIEDAALNRVHVYFPDPWPKKRHHKRRLLQKSFLALLAKKIEAHGYLHIITDWEPYASQIRELIEANITWFGKAPLDETANSRIQTSFERKATSKDRDLFEFFVRRSDKSY